MEPQELITALKSQHRTLQSDLSSALEKTNAEAEDKGENILSDLTKFKTELLAHVKMEGEMFYPDYLHKKTQRGEEIESTKKFINEMDEIAKVVMNFLDKYPSADNINNSLSAFREELNGIVGVLNVRIETEEEGVFNVYLAM